MKKEFSLYKTMAIATVVIIIIAIIGVMDFSEMPSIEQINNLMAQPLELKNWHYAFIAFLIWIK